MYKNFFKRLIDFFVAFWGLLVLSPIFLLIMLLLFISNKGKPFFFQARPGKDAKIFRIVKFKTMNDKMDKEGNLLPDSERLTAIGAFVRKTSLDEMPQLINVLVGDMSLIGPRPLLAKYLPYYTEEEMRRHDVRPGITGLAQVNGRNTVSWDIRLQMDVDYVDSISFRLDMKIFFLTIKKVFKSEDIVIDPRSIMLDLDEERRL